MSKRPALPKTPPRLKDRPRRPDPDLVKEAQEGLGEGAEEVPDEEKGDLLDNVRD